MDGIPNLKVGETYLFFTVTYYFQGEVVSVGLTEVVLKDAWLIYGIPSLEKYFAAPSDKSVVQEKAELGDFVLGQRIGARRLNMKAKR